MDSISISVEPLVWAEPFVSAGWVVDFEAGIDTQKEEVQVESDAQSPVCSDALP